MAAPNKLLHGANASIVGLLIYAHTELSTMKTDLATVKQDVAAIKHVTYQATAPGAESLTNTLAINFHEK